MDYTAIRKLSLRAFIGFLVATAVIAVISVLSGEFGEFQLKVLATSLTISAASVCSMSCAAFIEKKKMAALGLSGIVLAIAAAVLLIGGMWPEIKSDEYWKTAITCVVFALAFAHAFLLILPDLDERQAWVQLTSSVSIGALALLIVFAVWGEIDDKAYYRLLAVVAILVALQTLIVPILMKLRKGASRERKLLVLERIEGELYKDSAGKAYRVKEVNADQGFATDAEPGR